MSPAYRWRKRSAAKEEGSWWERLGEVQDRVAITALAGSRSIRVEAFQLTLRQAEKLRRAFGGQISEEQAGRTPPAPGLRAPINIRGRLIVAATEEEARLARRKYPRADLLLIPAGMAFGTGDHATTVSCLRLLADAARLRTGQSWELLDLGTGTGILALAARLLGAERVQACDFDPAAVRTAKANALLNGLKKVALRRLDVRAWQPERTWPVVTANLFSELLIETAPALAAATATGGQLIFSGTLREQEAGVCAALQAAGFGLEQIVRKGKWVAGLARRTGRNARSA